MMIANIADNYGRLAAVTPLLIWIMPAASDSWITLRHVDLNQRERDHKKEKKITEKMRPLIKLN